MPSDWDYAKCRELKPGSPEFCSNNYKRNNINQDYTDSQSQYSTRVKHLKTVPYKDLFRQNQIPSYKQYKTPICRNSSQRFEHGDWYCPNPKCQDHQFARNSNCKKCGHPKPGNLYSYKRKQKPYLIFEGDWICPNVNCNDFQFGRNASCRKCGTSKPGTSLKFRHNSFTYPEKSNLNEYTANRMMSIIENTICNYCGEQVRNLGICISCGVTRNKQLPRY